MQISLPPLQAKASTFLYNMMQMSASLTFMDSHVLILKPHQPRQMVRILISRSPGEASSASAAAAAALGSRLCAFVCAPRITSLPAVRLRAASDGLHGLNLLQPSGQLAFAGLQQSCRPGIVPAQDVHHRLDPSSHYHLETHTGDMSSQTRSQPLIFR